MFKISGNNTVTVVFRNGWTVIFKFGAGHMCDNRRYNTDDHVPFSSFDCEMKVYNFVGDSKTALIWKEVFNLDVTTDSVGYVSPDRAARVLMFVSGLRSEVQY
jgi:hypothetical protein